MVRRPTPTVTPHIPSSGTALGNRPSPGGSSLAHEREVPGPEMAQEMIRIGNQIEHLRSAEANLRPAIQIVRPNGESWLGKSTRIRIKWTSAIKPGSLSVLLDQTDITGQISVDSVNGQATGWLSEADGIHELTVTADLISKFFPLTYGPYTAKCQFTTLSVDPKDSIFSLQIPEPVVLEVGTSGQIPVTVDRKGCSSIIDVSLEELPPHITASTGKIAFRTSSDPAHGISVQYFSSDSINVTADSNAEVGRSSIVVVAEAAATLDRPKWSDEASVSLFVVPKLEIFFDPKILHIDPGSDCDLKISILPGGEYRGEVAIEFLNLPAGVSLLGAPITIAAGEDSITVKVRADTQAPACRVESDAKITGVWTAAGRSFERIVPLNIEVTTPPIAIVLGGGGAKGDFQVGALQYLHEIGIVPSIVCGTSVGSLNAILLAEGPSGLTKIVSTWLSLNSNSDMYIEEPWLKTLSAGGKKLMSLSAASIIGNVAGEIAKSLVFPPMLIIDLVLAADEIDDMKDAAEKALGADCLYRLTPVKGKLAAQISDQARLASGIRLRLSAVRLDSGELEYIDERGEVLGQSSSGQASNMLDAAIASASIPGVFPPVTLNGHKYIDGGVRESLPIDAAIKAGAKRVYAIACSPAELTSGPEYNSSLVKDVVGRVAIDIMPDEIERNHREEAAESGVDIRYIRPRKGDLIHDTLTIDPGLIRISMAHGYMRAFDVLGTSEMTATTRSRLVELTSRIVQTRKQIWDLEFDANGEYHSDEEAARNHAAGTIPVPDPGALKYIRSLKRDVKNFVDERRRLGGAVPSGYDSWWKEWERHNWSGYIVSSPWDFFPSRLGDVPAENPP